MKTNYEKTMENFRDYLKSSSHNIVGENFSESSFRGFICESITSTDRLIIKIRVDENIEFAFVTVYAGLSIPKPYRVTAAQYCMRENDNKKVSYLGIDEDYGDIYAHIEASFKDAPLSAETLKDMERIAASSLMHSYDDLQQIARGVLMTDKSNDAEDRKLDLLSSLCNNMGLDDNDEDDEDEYDNDSHTPDIDIASMLKQLEEDEENAGPD